MADTPTAAVSQRPAKRTKYDLTSTFDIVVGSQQQRFTAHTNWLADSAKPVDLEDHDPEDFSAYLECVYFGIEAVKVDIEGERPEDPSDDVRNAEPKDTFEWSHEECKRRFGTPAEEGPYTLAAIAQILCLVRIYLEADKLQDCATENMIIDEIVRVGDETRCNPSREAVNLVYKSTVHGNPLRKLFRDYLVHETTSSEYLDLHINELDPECLRDIAVEFLRVKGPSRKMVLEDVFFCSAGLTKHTDKCHYHQHTSGQVCEPDSEPPTDDESESD